MVSTVLPLLNGSEGPGTEGRWIGACVWGLWSGHHSGCWKVYVSFPIRGKTDWNHNHRKLTSLITWTTAFPNSMKLWVMPVGPRKMDGSWWRVLTKCAPPEKGMANHFTLLALNLWAVWKGKKIAHRKMNSPGLLVPNKLLEKSGEITPERMKRLSWNENNTQLWMWLVIEASSNAVKSNIA